MSSFCLGLKEYGGIPQVILVGEGQSKQQNRRGVKAQGVCLVVQVVRE